RAVRRRTPVQGSDRSQDRGAHRKARAQGCIARGLPRSAGTTLAGDVAYRSWEGMPVMAASQPIEALIRALDQSVASGLSYFQGPGGQARIKVGVWGPREVLCHLVWWHQATVEGMESVLSGGKPHRFYASVDEMNARAVGRLADRDMAQLADLVRQWQAPRPPAAPAPP